jgi:hypothetical protein
VPTSLHTTSVTPNFKDKIECSLYVCLGSSCHTYTNNKSGLGPARDGSRLRVVLLISIFEISKKVTECFEIHNNSSISWKIMK